jgi:hypothetical protein
MMPIGVSSRIGEKRRIVSAYRRWRGRKPLINRTRFADCLG